MCVHVDYLLHGGCSRRPFFLWVSVRVTARGWAQRETCWGSRRSC
ncbi:hypothetical protein PSTAB_3143 [Stutzerimonas stutzeri]|uniref:Uncharacterized protein n=1 Tax=Stutzerimonas stutzeri (strain ATCC 17588 / DSM 5190 / CCUG 11256 / JCM 5965 / LMG 11199 / NBRC 14165 / NCIMB 11358 / Stanier 221) TaxID=96563 RepID=F8H9L7_STUS2|nr:hypothetical protein PSTAB_3143 [Stutzerimonas stutzeri]